MRKVLEATLALLCALAMLLGIAGVIARSPFSAAIPALRGTQPMVVLSGSMEPKLSVGGLAFVRPVDPGAVGVGDIIAFVEPKVGTAARPELTTHRVVAVDHRASGLAFTTKGDANRTADPAPVPAGAVRGAVVLAVPFLGYLSVFVRSLPGFGLLVVLPALLLVLSEAAEIVRELRRKRTGEESVESVEPAA